MPSAFYEQVDDDRWLALPATRGPWSPEHQHAGPPAALLGHTLATRLGDGRLVRCTFEILRPVPIGVLTTSVEVLRPGRRVAMGRAVLRADGEPVMTVQGWRMREADVGLPPDRPGADEAVAVEPLLPPSEATPRPFFDVDWDEGYHTAMDVRFVRGGFTEPGDAAAWLRCRVPLVADTELTPLQRLLVAADTGNGLSARLGQGDWLFVNTDLTVHVRELPAGEWVGLDARTRFGPAGIGLATATIHGAQGPVGTALQSLLVEPR